MKNHRLLRFHVFGALLVCAFTSVFGWAFENPLDTPASPSILAGVSPMQALAVAGSRIVAVGSRGQVVLFDGKSHQWRQAKVPVSNDLLAVSFPTAEQGWAVGHGGVIIHTSDGGLTWTKQLDGRQAAELAIRHFEQKGGHESVLLERERRLVEDGGTPSFMGVFFDSPTSGYVVGTFNRIFRTEDGGKTWMPWMGRVDNPKELHFYAVGGREGHVYIVGEQGGAWRLDESHERFVAIPTPYTGSLFGLAVGGANKLLVFGMRGSLYRSEDAGATWTKVKSGTSAGITAAVALPNGNILLTNLAGEVGLSHDGGASFSPVKLRRPMSYYSVVALPEGSVALAGSDGVRFEVLDGTGAGVTKTKSE